MSGLRPFGARAAETTERRGAPRRGLRRRRSIEAIVAALITASFIVNASPVAADDPSLPELSANGQVVTLSGDLTIGDSTLPQFVTEGSTNVDALIGGEFVINGPVGGDGIVVGGGGNDARRIGQTFGIPGTSSGSENVWGFLEKEARQILVAQHRIQNDDQIPYWGRGLMRAWMLIRLIEIIRMPVSDRTTEEQTAVTFLQEKMWDRQKLVIQRAIDQLGLWSAEPCVFEPPAPYEYEVGNACVPNNYVQLIIGTPPPPSAVDFLDYGATIAGEETLERIVRELSDKQGITLQQARPVVDTEFRRAAKELRAGLDLFRVLGKGLVDGSTDFSGSGQSPLTDETLTVLKTLFDEVVVEEAVGTLIEFALLHTLDSPSLPELLFVEAIVLTKAIWDRVDLELLDDRLLGAQAEIEATPPDLLAMLDADGGMGQILGTFMEETMHDHLYERKLSLATPPAQGSRDLQWERTTQADVSWGSSQQLANLPISDWRKPFGPTLPLIEASTRGHWLLLTDPSGGIALPPPSFGKISPNSPEQSLGIGYTDWDGDYWTAWWVGSTFIHVKEATPLQGRAGVRESIEGNCPPRPLGLEDQPTGLDCIEGSPSDPTAFFAQLHAGDTVLLGGEYRTVLHVADDRYVQITKPFAAAYGYQEIVKVATSRDTCWQTGECFDSDEIHYRESGQNLKARFVGNQPPSLNPQITGTLQTQVDTQDSIVAHGTIRNPLVTFGWAAGTDVTFEANAIDPEGDAVTIEWTFEPAATPCGSTPPFDCTVDGSTATFRWNEAGTYVVTATATDAAGGTSSWTRTIVILPTTTGNAPVAGDDAVETLEDTPVVVFVGAHDLDVDNDLVLATVSVSGGTHGTWVELGEGLVRYTPDAGFLGRAEASYEICDVTALCDEASIVVNVLPINEPPDAVDDTTSTSRETAVTITPWSNDIDREGGLVQGSIVRACTVAPSDCSTEDADLHGTWTIVQGHVTYTPAAGFVGTASYRYRICDTGGACDAASIHAHVIDNYRPVTAVDRPSTLEDSGPITIDVLTNDSDVDGSIVPETLSPKLCGTWRDPGYLLCILEVRELQGTWAVNADHTLSYTPLPDFWGTAIGRYQVCDDDGACTPGRVEITVQSVNDAPSFVAGPNQSVEENAAAQVVSGWATAIRPGPELPPFSTADDETWQVVEFIVGADRPSLFAVQPTIDENGTLRYTPAPGANGSTDVTVRLRDDGGIGDGGSNTSPPQTFTITINALNDPPTAADDVAATDEDTAVTIDALANDSDADGDALTLSSVSDPAHGTAEIVSGHIRYVPDANVNGDDTFTYEVCDATPACATATVRVTIQGVNDSPTIEGDASTQTIQYSDELADVTFTASDADDLAANLALTTDTLPTGLSFVDHGDGTGTLSGVAGVRQGSYEITVSSKDPDGLEGRTTFTLVVDAEDASVAFSASDPVVVNVEIPGGTSGSIMLRAFVSETEPDEPAGAAAAGDINKAATIMELLPVAGGSAISGSCSAAAVSPVLGYPDQQTVTCTFSGLPVNSYTVSVTVGGGWYVGSGENVLTVADPSLGFTTGGGWFYWPGTTDRTTFGYAMKYTSKLTQLKGSLLMIRHLQDGSIYRVKSTALDGLAVGQDRTIPMGWASFTGKATYLEPGWTDAIGNHVFTVYVEDRNEPGSGSDRIWISVTKGTTPVGLSMTGTGAGNAVALNGGNVVVPHQARN